MYYGYAVRVMLLYSLEERIVGHDDDCSPVGEEAAKQE